jgi:hypothetical protein
MLEQAATHMKDVVLRRRSHVLLQFVVLELNAERASTVWNVYVHQALQEIHMYNVKVGEHCQSILF